LKKAKFKIQYSEKAGCCKRNEYNITKEKEKKKKHELSMNEASKYIFTTRKIK